MRRAILVATVTLGSLTLAAVAAPPAFADPTIVRSCSPAPNTCKGWYRQPVTINWTVLPPTASVVGCVDRTVNFDTAGSTQSCYAEDEGVEASMSISLQVDMTLPVVTGATPSRGPDFNGWYRSPLQVAFAGSDAMSGVLGCSSGTYGGPDAAAAEVLGRCWDRAGNVSAPGTFDLRYDATAPSLAPVVASGRDHKVRLEWNVPDAAEVDVRRGERRLMLGGPSGSLVDRRLRNGRRYEYLVTATDAAGNTAKRTLAVVPGPRLFGPAAGARLDGPPLLRWTSVRGADYYNVQLFRGRRKILSAWPGKPRLQLHDTWRYGGHKRRLEPGRRYRWFVWPGEGARSRSDYGRLIGARTFVMTP